MKLWIIALGPDESVAISKARDKAREYGIERPVVKDAGSLNIDTIPKNMATIYYIASEYENLFVVDEQYTEGLTLFFGDKYKLVRMFQGQELQVRTPKSKDFDPIKSEFVLHIQDESQEVVCIRLDFEGYYGHMTGAVPVVLEKDMLWLSY